MKRELRETADGSHTISIPEMNVTYHSRYGAIQESRHVFIQAGMHHLLSTLSFSEANPLRIFEVGFGTGLNALLSFEEAVIKKIPVYYFAIEPYPLSVDEAAELNYVEQLGNEMLEPFFSLLHQSEWNKDGYLSSSFTIRKVNTPLDQIESSTKFNLIYFDAFAPDIQPELWETAMFEKLYNRLQTDGALVTYCCKGAVRRNLQSVGFTVEKLPGPPGKREIIRAIKKA